MRLFWKIFLLLLLTLLLTASLSSWLSQKWIMENQQIEQRLSILESFAETAVNLYALEGPHAYRQWLRHNLRSQRFQGALVDGQGKHVLFRPVPGPLRELAVQIVAEKKKVTIIHPPMLAVAIPVRHAGNLYYWLASTRLPPDAMQQESRNILLFRITMILLVIILISWLLTRMLTRPIRQLQQSSEKLGEGKLNTRVSASVSKRSDELGDLGRSFDSMAEALDRLIHSHKQLLRDISHELRSPLARLQVALELARNEAGDNAADELDRINLEAERLNELIGEVLTLARFEQGAVRAENEVLQLDELLQSILDDAIFEAESDNKQVTILQVDSCSICGDLIWIGRALENIIRNAIRHTESGSSVEVSLSCHTSDAVLTIRDFGKGVDEEMLPRLFEPFFRVSDAREREEKADTGGYGIGLAIAKRAIELHRGRISVRNHPEGGLEVTIVIPMVTATL